MKTHRSQCWSIGIHWVAWIKNNRYHSTTEFTPYQLQYGVIARNKLLNLPLDPHLLCALETETQLMKHHKFDVSDSESEDEEDLARPRLIVSPDGTNYEDGLIHLKTVLLDNNPDSFAVRRRKELVEGGVKRNVLQSALLVEVEEGTSDDDPEFQTSAEIDTALLEGPMGDMSLDAPCGGYPTWDDPAESEVNDDFYRTQYEDGILDDPIAKGVLIPETLLPQDASVEDSDAENNVSNFNIINIIKFY